MKTEWGKQSEDENTALNLRLSQLTARLNRLTDAFLDAAIDKAMFEERKAALLAERKGLEETTALLKVNKQGVPGEMEKFLELAGSALLSYETALPDEKRSLVRNLTSNRALNGKNLDLKLSIPYDEVANRFKYSNGGPYRTIPRTIDELLTKLKVFFSTNHAPGWDTGDRDGTSLTE